MSNPFTQVQACNELMSAELKNIMGVKPYWFRSPLTDTNAAQRLPVLVLSQTTGAAVVTGMQLNYELALIAGTFEDAYALLSKLSSVLEEGRMSDDKIQMWVSLSNFETAYDPENHAVINVHIIAVLEKGEK